MATLQHTSFQAFIKRHPVLTYYVLAFAISWGGILSVVGGSGGIQAQVARLFPFMMLAWLAGPSVASILLTGLVDGRAGIRELFSRLLRWRVGVRWYAIALLSGPLVFAATLFALSLTSPVFLPGIVTSADKVTLLLSGIAVGFTTIFEELGWTGFAVPRLRRQYGVFATGLIVGLLWGAYHFSVVFWAGRPSGVLALGLILPAQLFAWLPPFRVLMVWVYDRTRSLLVVTLMHASLTASVIFILLPPATGVPQLTYLLVFGAALWVVVAVVTVANGGRLSRGEHTHAIPFTHPL